MAKIPLNNPKTQQIFSPVNPSVKSIQTVGKVNPTVQIPVQNGLDTLAGAIGQTADVLIAKRNQQIAEDQRNFLTSENNRISKELFQKIQDEKQLVGSDAFGGADRMRKAGDNIKPSKKLTPDALVLFNNQKDALINRAVSVASQHESKQRAVEKANIVQDLTANLSDAGALENPDVTTAEQNINDTLDLVIQTENLNPQDTALIASERLKLSDTYYNSMLSKVEADDPSGISLLNFFDTNKDAIIANTKASTFNVWQRKIPPLRETKTLNNIDTTVRDLFAKQNPGIEPNPLELQATAFDSISQLKKLGFKVSDIDKMSNIWGRNQTVQNNIRTELERTNKNNFYSDAIDLYTEYDKAIGQEKSNIGTAIEEFITKTPNLTGSEKLTARNNFKNYARNNATTPKVLNDASLKVIDGTISETQLYFLLGNGLSSTDYKDLRTQLRQNMKQNRSGRTNYFEKTVSAVMQTVKTEKLEITTASGGKRTVNANDVRMALIAEARDSKNKDGKPISPYNVQYMELGSMLTDTKRRGWFTFPNPLPKTEKPKFIQTPTGVVRQNPTSVTKKEDASIKIKEDKEITTFLKGLKATPEQISLILSSPNKRAETLKLATGSK